MVKKILALSGFFIFISCFTLKTEYGNVRFKLDNFKLKQNTDNNVYNYIDTNAIYKLVSLKYDGLETKNYNYRKYFLKFYDKGRVGKFDFFDINDNNCINPKKADMGIYNFNGKILRMEFYHEHPQGNFFSVDSVGIYKDSIVIFNKKYNERGNHIKITIPKEWKRCKPDW